MSTHLAALSVRTFGLLLILASVRGVAGQTVDIVNDGQSTAVIVVDPGAPAMAREAGKLLQRVIEQSSGAKLAILDGNPKARNEVTIRLRTEPGDRSLDKDGFVLAFPEANRIEIIGGSAHGTIFGAQDFLERYLGVRWLLPGDLGEYIPRHRTISIPRREIRQEPAFFSRQLSGRSFHGGREKNPLAMFLFRQRMHGRMRFHHNLLHLYPASQYAESHPEFYPIIDGKRYLPKNDRDYHWQPNLRAKGIVEEGVRNIDGFFDKHPDAESYSLGMNDSHAWDDSVMKAANATRNSVGRIDLSDYFFGWANRIADGVLAKHPDKWFGCLAYNELTDPPKKVGLNPRILPYVCIDRMFWADPEQRRLDQARTRAWMQVAPRLAWYDYIYGDEFYKAPRFYPHLMGEYIRFAHEQGVVAYYAEAYPTPKWTEGPKLYVFLRLLWDPYLDVDATLAEWYRLTVGERAAPYLSEYYEFWETFWTKRVPKTNWFRDSVKTAPYLHFGRAGYFEALRIGEEERLDALIENVVAHARTPEQKARAVFIRAGWGLVRTEMANYLAIKKLVEHGPPPGTRLTPVFSSDFESEESTGRPAAAGRDDWRSAGMPKGWGHWQRTGSHATFGWDRRTGKRSRGALTLDAGGSDGQPLCFLRSVAVDSNTLYRAACDVRTVDLDNAAAVGITVKWQDKTGKWTTRYTNVDRRLEKPTAGRWEHVVAYVRTPAIEKPRLVFMLLVDGAKKGRVWFDNVELSRLVPDQQAAD
ncbi:MAG: DUF4838 domain-containing protein [Kiritimatiellaeota bacterium]|nr:DUF4838 domain-containing protein [Kiritimatiellota bacterium]